MADLAILGAPDAQTTPQLLVLDASSPSPSIARIAVLRRNDRWVQAASADIDLGADDLAARWFAELSEDRYALIATSLQGVPGPGHGVAVSLAVDARNGAVRIDELNRLSFDRAIDDTAAADVDGYGSAELVLGLRQFGSLDSCGTSALIVVDGTITAVRRSIDVVGLHGAGVLGQFDAVPGAELLAYSSRGCLPAGDFGTNLLAIRLADGSQSTAVEGVPKYFDLALPPLPPPLLVDLDGSAPDEVIAPGEAGLAVFDPSDDWRSLILADAFSIPLVAGATGRAELPEVRVATLDTDSARLVSARLRRDNGGLAVSGRSELALNSKDPARWSVLRGGVEGAGTHQAAPTSWIGDAFASGCPDVMLPGAILPCRTDDLQPGPAWLATRPVAALQIGDQRVMLVAAGLGWRAETGLPASPTPAATGPRGWWRHGPSAPFALSEISPDEIARFGAVSTPAATVSTTTAADGVAELAGPSGTRFFATVVPLAEGQRPLPSTDALRALTTRPLTGGRRDVVRVPVPPAAGSGPAASSASLDLGDLEPPGDQPVSGWAVRVVPLNDLGEWGQPVTGTITLDDVAPTVEVEGPFASPAWPFFADIEGRSEPGTTVRVDGIGDVEVDGRGVFTIHAQLAPWPQSFRVTATDPAGNQTVGSFSVVGGVDYRRFPWSEIIVVGLLGLVTARGLFGSELGRAADAPTTASSPGEVDDAALLPVIEELPPGTGLAHR
jgi:hypothetical protein